MTALTGDVTALSGDVAALTGTAAVRDMTAAAAGRAGLCCTQRLRWRRVGFERLAVGGSEAAVDRSWRGWAGDEWSIETRTSNAIINLFVGFERRGSEAAVDRSWRGWAGREKLLKCRRSGIGRGADAPFKGLWGNRRCLGFELC